LIIKKIIALMEFLKEIDYRIQHRNRKTDMNTHRLQLDIPSLQRDTVALLENISAFISRFDDGRYQEQIRHQIHLVQNLELRMTIVAPMKAGKSTIINGIIGQEIVPSHNAAMTTLPTELALNPDLTEPVLKLPKPLFSKFQTIIQRLREKIHENTIEWAYQQTAGYPHLKTLLSKIAEDFSISANISGRKAILEVLTGMNHIIRLSSLLTPDIELFSVAELPQIETPFWQSSEIAKFQHQGKLVLVDTPGPNEAGNMGLKSVVSEQLLKSSVILIVLNFTALNTEADESVKQDVDEIIRLRGKENLYVLVNWIDLRKKGDMTQEEVREFVASKFGITDKDHIFEISAKRAFIATNFLRELQTQPDIAVSEMETSESLAIETLGQRWEEKLKSINTAELKNEANYLWDNSGFAPFLENAMKTLITESPHKCMRTAIETGKNCLSRLPNKDPNGFKNH